MGIPGLGPNNELPAGIHPATLDEIEAVHGHANAQRRALMGGLRKAVANLDAAGVRSIWVNGSFVTGKKEPNDIDGCWEYHDLVDPGILDPVFLGDRVGMKQKYGLDFFVANVIEMESGMPFPMFFQRNRDGEPKGIIVIHSGVQS